MNQDNQHQEDGHEGHGHRDHHHHEHPDHQVTIIVNGKDKHWPEERISYEQVVKLSGEPLPPGPNPGFTVTYFDGPHDKPDGSVTEGHSVKVKNHMVFNVTPTNRS